MNGKYNRQGLVTEIDFSKNDIAIIQHQVFVNNDGTLYCPENRNLDDFYERSHQITDNSFIKSNYLSYIANNTKLQTDYIQSYRGKSITGTLLRKLFPNYYKKWICRQYSEQHLLRILLSLQSDRTGENVLCVWEKIYRELNNKR